MTYTLHLGNCLEVMKGMDEKSVHCCVTSPPYWGLRDYGVDEQLGMESTPEAYVENMVNVFRGVWRILRDDGVVFLNLGDSYFSDTKGSGGPSEKQESNAGSWYEPVRFKHDTLKPKDLVGIPWRVALALQADGWYLRSDIIWHKPNPMPESVTDRPTKSHEYIFLLTKSERYYYDAEAVRESAEPKSAERYKYTFANNTEKHAERVSGGMQNIAWNDGIREFSGTRNKRSVWTVPTHPYSGAHFATFPPKLIEPCILAGCPVGGVVLDPFNGAGTTGVVALQHGRRYVGIELNPEYLEMARQRIDELSTTKPVYLTGAAEDTDDLPLFSPLDSQAQ